MSRAWLLAPGLVALAATVVAPDGASTGAGTDAWEAELRGTHAAEAPPELESPLYRLLYINLDRRRDRRSHFLRQVRRLGLGDLTRRVPAIDGRTLDLSSASLSGLVAPRRLRRALHPPKEVRGHVITRGSVGQVATYQALLEAIAADPDEGHIYVVAEDDVTFGGDFLPRLRRVLDAAALADPRWDLLHLGYYRRFSQMNDTVSGEPGRLLARPAKVYGLCGWAARPRGARALLKHMFPVQEQLDSGLRRIYDRISALVVKLPLLWAKPSVKGDTDIQIL